MGAFKDLTGQKFNKLLVLFPLKERKNGSVVWHCKCDCGNECNVVSPSLIKGRTKSCGCLKIESDHAPKGNVKDLLNQTFGHLTVIARDGSDERGEAKWKCQCDCDNHTIISCLGSNLRTGHTQSCGCDRNSRGEKIIANLLIDNHIPFTTQKTFFKYSNGHNAPFDFYINDSYLLEYDGETHDITYANKHGWLTTESIQQQLIRDNIKNEWCKKNHIPLIRIPYTHLHNLCIEDLLLTSSKFIINQGDNNENKNN